MNPITTIVFILLPMLMPLADIALSAADHTGNEVNNPNDLPYWEDRAQESTSLRGANRLLAQRGTMTCDKYPRVCRTSGSPGPDCCRKKCVNVSKDRLNCGKCGNKCKYSEVCCKGRCVNPRFDRKNCGGCNNKCKSGSKCVYGMCSYA